jgi:salicylate hydroxylase
MKSPLIVVAGAGIAGLAAALALGKREVVIAEQAASLSDIGAGLQLGPNAVRALEKLGVWDAVEPITSSPPEIHLRDGITGNLLRRLPLGTEFMQRYGTSYRAAHRADLHAALSQCVKVKSNIHLHLGEKITRVDLGMDDVLVQCTGTQFSCPSLIVADGVKSTIRQTLFPGTQAVDSGVTHHRALIDIPSIADVEMDCVNLWMYPGGHVVHYPVGRQPKLNIVALAPHGLKPLGHFKNAATSLNTILSITAPHFTPWPGLSAPPMSSWCKGNVMLIGDAAHGTLPYLAQGAAMALEDAACLATVMMNTRSLRHAFAETAQLRMARTTRLHIETLRAGRIYHMSKLTRQARNITLAIAPRTSIARKLDWLYKG